MPSRNAHVEVSIDNTPQAVMDYIADTGNRTMFLPSLKSLTMIEGEPSAVGASWKWTWVMLGVEFVGTAKCTAHEPGQRYEFETQGGIASTFKYEAKAAGEGTQLSIDVAFDLPESLLSKAGVDQLLEASKQKETELVAQNLKVILDR